VRLRGTSRRRRSDDRGQSIVEFALLAPLMIFILFAILDLSRIYTTMMSVESAAREAADFGTALGAERWSLSNEPTTVAEMERRACVAASDLPDFEWTDTDTDGVIDTGESCTNPTFDHCLRKVPAGPCLVPTDTGYDCDDPENNDPASDPPCTVTVTMAHTFHLFVPFQIDFFGVKLGLPVTLDFERDSTYAMTDIDVASPSPGP
jgi:hypothetical protein